MKMMADAGVAADGWQARRRPSEIIDTRRAVVRTTRSGGRTGGEGDEGEVRRGVLPRWVATWARESGTDPGSGQKICHPPST